MSSGSDVTLGSQQPRVSLHPAAEDFADAVEAVELAANYGLVPDPWQEHVLRGWMGRKRDGSLAAGRCGVAVPRQNGKNGSVEIVQLHKMVMQGRRILHTAHEVKTARKAFQRLASFFENERKYPELAELVKEVRRTNGQEAIVLLNGASVEFVARSRGSGRGYTVDDLFCDEAQELTDEQLEALLPTIAAAPSQDPQIVFLGTPPGENAAGEVFARVRAEGVLGRDKRLAWDEWSIPDEMTVAEAVKRWRELAPLTNPALGFRLRMTTVEDELKAMSGEGFCRERLGRWDSIAGNAAISWDAWNDSRGSQPVSDARTVFGVKFTVDGSGVALAAARRPVDGPVYVEAIRQANLGEGTQWLVDWLSERHQRAAQIVIDGKAGVGYLVNALREAGVRNKRLVLLPTLDQILSAHSMFEQAVTMGLLSHGDQPELDDQVRAALKRKIGTSGGFGWDAPDGGSVAMLDAVTLAHWGAKTTKRNPGRSGGAVVL
ncbi:hypothetical protein D9V30_00115 [Mycetocola reblochoni]|uniref:Terminase n=1 Tax=Mycetocola reblochoni TaxID=331618 RepID=A0A3L6ZSN4_9MICO|nr:hypothetical protein [Mycetocola reblochoni]RLP70878.1 hypothetical protein D9V30_00115 [Mycetocola reblochoni]